MKNLKEWIQPTNTSLHNVPINESLCLWNAKLNKVKEKIKANKTSGLMESTNFIFCKRLIFGLQHLQ
jgi:hypothetical protein